MIGVYAMLNNLQWNEKTMPSEILRQILQQEEKSVDRTNNNLYALAFAIGKAEALEYPHSKFVVQKRVDSK